MNSFHFHRFLQTLRWVLRMNGRKMLYALAGSTAGVFIGELAVKGIGQYKDPYVLIFNYAQIWTALLVITLMVMLCSVVSTINEKRKREAFLMLPATNLEKFLALIVLTTLAWPLCLFLAVALGDTLRMAFFWLKGVDSATISVSNDYTGQTYYWWSSAVPQLLENLTPKGLQDFYLPELLFSVVALVFLHSWYTLFGTVLRKYAFVVSNVVGISLILLVIKTVHLCGVANIFLFHKTWEHGTYIHSASPVVYPVMIVLLLLLVCNYLASFRIFKHFQLITNKWTNYDIHKR